MAATVANQFSERVTYAHKMKIVAAWQNLSDSQQVMFGRVKSGCEKFKGLQNPNPDEISYFGWVTRYQIADEFQSMRLIPHQVKLLEKLTQPIKGLDGLKFLEAKKRTKWRWAKGVRRPGGFEWVYRPTPEILRVLGEHQSGAILPPAPVVYVEPATKRYYMTDDWPEAYRDRLPSSSKSFEIPPLTLGDHFAAWREELGEAFKYIFTFRWLRG